MQDDNRMNRDGLISLAGGVPVYGGDMLDRYMLSMCLYIVYIYICAARSLHARDGRGEQRRDKERTAQGRCRRCTDGEKTRNGSVGPAGVRNEE